MHIEFENLCNASKHMIMHISNAINQSLWACSPYLCASLVQEFWSISFLQCCSLFVHVQPLFLLYLISPCPISPPFNQAFISLYNLSPFVINFHKRYASYWCKGILFGVDGWDLHFWWTLLEYRNDTTSRYHLELVTCITCILSFYAWVIHFMHLSSCRWGMHSSFDDHLKLRITCGTIVLHDWYHV